MSDSRSPVKDLVLIPSLITLAITLVRLAGELLNWSPSLFSREPGGGGSVIGISWLIPVFGGWFGLRLTRMGESVDRPLKTAGLAFLTGLIVSAVSFAGGQVGGQNGFYGVFIVSSVAAVSLTRGLWPSLWKTLLVYAFAARIPVALVMLAAILGDWGTHYDVPPPGFPTVSPLAKWFLIGLLPQMTLWIYMTVIGGLVAGGLAGAIARKK